MDSLHNMVSPRFVFFGHGEKVQLLWYVVVQNCNQFYFQWIPPLIICLCNEMLETECWLVGPIHNNWTEFIRLEDGAVSLFSMLPPLSCYHRYVHGLTMMDISFGHVANYCIMQYGIYVFKNRALFKKTYFSNLDFGATTLPSGRKVPFSWRISIAQHL